MNAIPAAQETHGRLWQASMGPQVIGCYFTVTFTVTTLVEAAL